MEQFGKDESRTKPRRIKIGEDIEKVWGNFGEPMREGVKIWKCDTRDKNETWCDSECEKTII